MQVDGQRDVLTDKAVVKHMSTRPEGFFWWQKGQYDDDKVQRDLREKLPAWYGSHGYIDFQVTSDSIAVDSDHRQGGAAPGRSRRDIGYKVGRFEISGNRRFSTEELTTFYPFNGAASAGQSVQLGRSGIRRPRTSGPCTATTATSTPRSFRRRPGGPGPTGKACIDLNWTIREGAARDDQQDRDRRERRDARAGDP